MENTIITIDTIVNSFKDGELFDVTGFEKLLDEMKEFKKSLKDIEKKAKAEETKAKNEELDEIGKAYYKSLKDGDIFQFKDSNKKVWTAKKITTKSNTGKRASCELIVSAEEIAEYEIKKFTRSPFFRQVIIPQTEENEVEENEEEIA